MGGSIGYLGLLERRGYLEYRSVPPESSLKMETKNVMQFMAI